MRRLRLAFAATLAFTLLSGAAALIGRAIPTTVVAVDLSAGARDGQVIIGAFDMRRDVLLQTTLHFPFKIDVRLSGATLRVLQKRVYLEFVDWTFTDVAVDTGAVIPLMTLTTSKNAYFEPFDLLPLDDESLRDPAHPGRYRLYQEDTGEIWETGGGANTRANVVTLIDPNMRSFIWLDGGQRFTALGINSLFTMNLDGSDRREDVTYRTEGRYPLLSPDGRSLILRAYAIAAVTRPQPVIDVRTLEQTGEYTGYSPAWCGGGRLAYISQNDAGQIVSHVADLAAGTVDSIVLTALPAQLDRIAMSLVDAASCDWFVVQGSNAAAFLLHRPTGTFFPYSLSAHVRAVTGSGISYQITAADQLELRRIDLDPTPRAVVVESHPLIGTFSFNDIDLWRGLSTDWETLVYVDMVAGTRTTLIEDGVRSFYVIR